MVPRLVCWWLADGSFDGEGAFGNRNQGQRARLQISSVLLCIVQHHRSLLKHLIVATGYMGMLLINKSQFWTLRTLRSFNEKAKITTMEKIRGVP